MPTRTLLPGGRERELLDEELKKAGYMPLNRLEGMGGNWMPIDVAISTIQRAYDLSVTSVLRTEEQK